MKRFYLVLIAIFVILGIALAQTKIRATSGNFGSLTLNGVSCCVTSVSGSGIVTVTNGNTTPVVALTNLYQNTVPVSVNGVVSTQQTMMSIGAFSGAQYLNAINKQFRMSANGQFTGFVNTTEQVQLGFQFNGTNVTLATFIPTGTGAASWSYTASCVVTTAGTGSVLDCFSEVRVEGNNGVAGFANVISKMTNNTNATGGNLTGTITPSTVVSFQTASGTNACTQNLFYYEQLN